MPWVSQGVLMGATGSAGAPGATGPAGPSQSTTTSASFVMPALNATKAITVVSAAWTKLGQTLWISDGTNSGFWEITTRTSATALTITNRGYTGTPASGTMATAAIVQLIGPGIGTPAAPGFVRPAALTTFSSFLTPSVGNGVTVTVASTSDVFTPGAQAHYLTDGTNTFIGLVQSIGTGTITYACLYNYPGAGTTIGAGRVYMGWLPPLLDQADVAIPTSNAASLISSNPTAPGLNDLVGSSLVIVTPPAGGTPPFGSGLITLSLNAPTSGNATSGQVVKGNDTRLSDARTALATGGTSHYYDCDEFIGTIPKFMTLGNAAGAGAISASFIGSFGAGRAGVIQLAPGTTANLAAYLIYGPVYLVNGTITFRASVYLGTGNTGAANQIFFGLCNNASSAISTTGSYAGFYFQGNTSTHWLYETRNLTAVTSADSGVVATLTTWFELEIVATASSVSFYINGTLISAVSTNLPPSTQALYFTVFNNAVSSAANNSVYVDKVEIDIDSAITGKFLKAAI